MKATALLLCGLALFAAVNCGNNNANNNHQQQADKQFLQMQNNLMQLYMNVHQDNNNNQQQQEQANNFSFQQQQQNSNNPQAVQQFQNTYQQGVLPRGEVFNYNNPNHLQQAIQMFDLFYFAKDYQTFYQAACWARNNMNEGMFVYAMSVAILNRPDTQGIFLPPLSEVHPHMYVNAQAVQQAQNHKQQGHKQAVMQSNNTNNYIYNMQQQQQQQQQQNPEDYPFNHQNQNYDNENTANQYMNNQNQNMNMNQNNQEGHVSYYNEDINLNQQFAYEQLKNPSWMNNEKYQNQQQNQNQNNGENFYYYLQQLLARYNLERNTHGMENVQPMQFNMNNNINMVGYNPQIQYANGQNMPNRPNNMNMNNANANTMQQMQNMENRIADAVDSHQVQKADGTMMQMDNQNAVQVMGNIMQNNGDSVNNQFYGANNGMYGYLDQCRKVVGSITNNNNDNQNNVPSAIENDHSANRDPAFYQCVSSVVNHFQNLKNQMKPYNQEQLNFQGVKVQTVNADKLITYFDNAQVSMHNAINYQQDERPQNFMAQYVAQQQQLNNQPFNYQIQVNSQQEANAIVRVFIGPKYNAQGQQQSLEQARQNFVEIDRFSVHLKNGQNNIQRNSQQSTRFVQQLTMQQIMNQAAQTNNQNMAQQQATFPQNLMLPMGSRQGQEYVLAVAVHPCQQCNQQNQDQQNQQQPNDNRPQGFPFDRVVRENNFQQAQNIHFQTVKVFNKNQNNQQ